MIRHSVAPTLKAAAFLTMLASLAGCATSDRIKASSIPEEDYRIRHPIVLADTRNSVDVFPSGQGRLDRHTAKQIFAFADQYRDIGHGPILILLPRGRYGDQRALVGDIRHVLSAGGARDGVEVSTYPVADPGLASPVRLSFNGIKAKVGDQCGQWPHDLSSGSNIETWENKPYWNLGCSTQTMLAAQASDPRDLVTPRGEDQTDAVIRIRGIDSVRKGTDPNTSWSTHNSNIGSVGGN